MNHKLAAVVAVAVLAGAPMVAGCSSSPPPTVARLQADGYSSSIHQGSFSGSTQDCGPVFTGYVTQYAWGGGPLGVEIVMQFPTSTQAGLVAGTLEDGSFSNVEQAGDLVAASGTGADVASFLSSTQC
jgi:hypothetical protein